MQIEDIRTIVWDNLGQTRLQVKVGGKWQDVQFVDAMTLNIENGICQEVKNEIHHRRD